MLRPSLRPPSLYTAATTNVKFCAAEDPSIRREEKEREEEKCRRETEQEADGRRREGRIHQSYV